MISKNKYYLLIAFSIFCLGTALRLIGLNKGIWLDEYFAIKIATSNATIHQLQLNNYPPAAFYLLKAWSQISTTEPFLRMLSVILGVMTILVVMIWLKSYSKSASLLAGFLVATSPILLRYSQEIQAYALLFFSASLAFYCAYKVSRSKSNLLWNILLAIALMIVVTTHTVGIMVMVGVFVYVLPAFFHERRLSVWVKFLLSFTIPTIVFFISYLFFSKAFDPATWWMPPLSTALITSHFNYILGIREISLPIGNLAKLGPIFPSVFSWGVNIIAIISCGLLLFLGEWKQTWSILAAALIYWLSIVIYSLLFVPIFWYRTIMLGMIPLIVFIAIQAVSIKNQAIRIFVILSVTFLGLLSARGWVKMDAPFPWERWKQASQYLQSNVQQGDLVAFYPDYTEEVIRYYFSTLPDENTIPLKVGFNVISTESEIDRQVISSKNNNPSINVFFFVRKPGNDQDSLACDELLAYFRSTAQKVYSPLEMGILTIYGFEIQH